MKIQDTLTGKEKELDNSGNVRIYLCGVTVYDESHIGHARTIIVFDVLRKYLEKKGVEIEFVQNFTDVDDKIINRAQKENTTAEMISTKYIENYFKDFDGLNVKRATNYPKATEHIEDIIKFIEKLIEKQIAYTTKNGVYFSISKFPKYGKLSKKKIDELQSGSRIEIDEEKRDPLDFAVWKFSDVLPVWISPWGKGRPGWHIECSAMSIKYLGENFDIHGGGRDLIFPHHENEIAQSEAATGEPFVRFWIHSEFLLVDSGKMSKSEGNQYTLRDLIKRGCDPLAVRYLLQSVHYRKQLNFTFEGVDQAQSALRRIHDFLLRVGEVADERPENPDLTQKVAETRGDFQAGLDDDLNTSVALAALFDLMKGTNILLESQEVGGVNRDQILGLFSEAHQVFAVFETEELQIQDQEIAELIEERKEARRQRDFQRSDEIRDLLADRGIVLEDTKAGTRWKRTG